MVFFQPVTSRISVSLTESPTFSFDVSNACNAECVLGTVIDAARNKAVADLQRDHRRSSLLDLLPEFGHSGRANSCV